MATIALFVAMLGVVLGAAALLLILWVAAQANRLAQVMADARIITADSKAPVIRSLAGDPVTASATERTITGLIAPYNIPGDTSDGALIVAPGAFQLPADLTRVKLLNGHDRERPIAYLTAVRDQPEGLFGTFVVRSGPDGDEALTAVRERIRDGLSYEASRAEYSADRSTVVSARLDAVALCSVPAYDDARAIAASRHERHDMLTLESARALLANSDAPDHERAAAIAYLLAHADATDADRAAANEAAGNSTDATDANDAGQTDADADTPNPALVTAAQVPFGLRSLTAGRSGRALTAEQGVARMANALRGAVDAGQVNAALADVIPANDSGAGLLRPQWLGELWTAQNVQRDFIDAYSHAPLSSGLKVQGWRWVNKPEVGPWAGNKTEIPTNPVKTEPADAPIERIAGGWDVDRIFFDLGDAGFLQSFLAAATEDYGRKSEDAFALKIAAAASVAPDKAANLLEAMDVAARALSMRGARVSSIAMSTDLWSQYLAIKASDAPWWLQNQGSVNLADSTTNAAHLSAFANHALPAGTVIAGDRRAATYYEAAGSPIRVQAVNVPLGGIDLGVYGYNATLIHDKTGIVRVNVGAGE